MADFLTEDQIRRILRGAGNRDDDKLIGGFGFGMTFGQLRALCATALVAAPSLDAARAAVSFARDPD